MQLLLLLMVVALQPMTLALQALILMVGLLMA
jgi:hypothetical protein